MRGKAPVVDYLLQMGAERACRDDAGWSAMELTDKYEVKQVLHNFDKRVCRIVCDELGKKYYSNVFNVLRIDEYL